MPLEEKGFTKRRKNNGFSSFIDDVPKSRSAHDCLLGVNEKFLLDNNNCFNRKFEPASGEKSHGWYDYRKGYRSVAYKTWTVGAARRLLTGTKTLNSIKNGFISDSDSVDDEPSCSFYPKSKKCLLLGDNAKMPSTSRDPSETRSFCESRREIKNSNFASTKESCVRFDKKTEVDFEFRAVIDTFKDLQNFIAASKDQQKKRPENFGYCSKCLNSLTDIRRDYNLPRKNQIINNSQLFESFDNADQAIRFLKEELRNLRKRDLLLLQRLQDIKTEIRTNESDGSNCLCNCRSADLPPIPKCLQ